jgi:glycogen operon protein
MRNLLATLLFAQGTPMLLAGDEFGRTQQGNNNAYCQDNELSWVDWNIDEEGQGLIAFTRRLIALRRAYPILRRGRFFVGHYNEELGVKDATWLAPNGEEMSEENWHDGEARCMGMLLDGRAQPTGIRRSGADATLLLILNAYHESVDFLLPEVAEGSAWVGLLDSNQPQQRSSEQFAFGSQFQVAPRSLLLFKLQKEGD